MAETSRPVLLAQNRKIRHLQGIFLRNLTFDRPHGRTADDSAVKHSPGKVELLRETAQLQLHHSASSEQLSRRPGTARRRSTNLGNATPFVRQRHLEASIEKRVADVFFSLHVEGEEGPVYISEVGERGTVRTTPPLATTARADGVKLTLMRGLRTSTSVSSNCRAPSIPPSSDSLTLRSRSGRREPGHGRCTSNSWWTCAG